MKYEIQSGIPVGTIKNKTPDHPLWEIAEKMEIGDCVTFNARCDEGRADASVLMRFLTMQYGVKHNKASIRPWTSKTEHGIRRIWRIDPYEKIKAKRGKI
jgi:hypothetical protein